MAIESPTTATRTPLSSRQDDETTRVSKGIRAASSRDVADDAGADETANMEQKHDKKRKEIGTAKKNTVRRKKSRQSVFRQAVGIYTLRSSRLSCTKTKMKERVKQQRQPASGFFDQTTVTRMCTTATATGTTTATTIPLLSRHGGVSTQIGVVMGADSSKDVTGVADVDDDILLRRHFPRYHFDKEETVFPRDINKYMVDKSSSPGCNGTVVRKEDGTVHLIYLNFYLADGGLQICGFDCTCCTVGGHPYDLEVVIVELDQTGTLSGLLFAPHGSEEHFWVRDPEDLEAALGGEGGDGARPKVFVSRGTHASYPVSGTVYRIFGFANDVCNDPVESEIPFVPLEQAAIDLELIDDVFSGPKSKITRDWSVAPVSRVSSVKYQRLLPAWSQITGAAGENLSVSVS
eukprot:jgi/Undpi1/12916/HiC_scaffold_7.g02582.m1